MLNTNPPRSTKEDDPCCPQAGVRLMRTSAPVSLFTEVFGFLWISLQWISKADFFIVDVARIKAFQGLVTLYGKRNALVGWLMIMCGVLVPLPSVLSVVVSVPKISPHAPSCTWINHSFRPLVFFLLQQFSRATLGLPNVSSKAVNKDPWVFFFSACVQCNQS